MIRSLTVVAWVTCVAIGFAWLAGCESKKIELPQASEVPNCDTSNVTFSGSVQPILQQRCINEGCHCVTCDNIGFPSDALWDQYENFKRYATKGSVSDRINGRTFPPMPFGDRPSLSRCDIRKIEIWVEKGALND